MTRDISKHQASIFLIATACLLLLMSFGYRSSFGLFVKPLSAAHGWGREVISLALAIQNLSWGIVAVFAGALAVFAGIIHWLIIERPVARLVAKKV